MQKALAPEISTWPEENFQLIGSQCGKCGETQFPVQKQCPNCSASDMSDVLLPRDGTIIAWTTQSFIPSFPYIGKESAADFVPFGVALVQLGDVIRVEGRLTEPDMDAIEFDQKVELTMVPFAADDEGNEIMTYAFQPA
jgi:uncharacterized OB-fold protein